MAYSKIFADIVSLETGEKIKTIKDISDIAINDSYLFYVTKKRNNRGWIENAEITVEKLNSLQNSNG